MIVFFFFFSCSGCEGDNRRDIEAPVVLNQSLLATEYGHGDEATPFLRCFATKYICLVVASRFLMSYFAIMRLCNMLLAAIV